MKLINKTSIDDNILRSVLLAGANSLHKRIRTTNVVVMVTNRQGYSGTSGETYNAIAVRWGGKRWIKTDCGAFKIRLPRIPHPKAIIETAESFFNTARHEWGHIYDLQCGDKIFSGGKRRPAHDKRPEEIRVYNYIDKSGSTPNDYYESIMQLALAFE